MTDQPLSPSRLTACVIARDEERTIERALRSLSFADEIVVVDGGSTDRTREIAARYATRVIENPWRGFADQRNVALSSSRGEWVFFLDSDEQASEELGRRLRAIASDEPSRHPECYSIRRIEYFLGKELRFGPGNPSHQWRFFKRAGVSFEGEVHEFPRFKGPVGRIEEPILHDPDLGIDRFLSKLNRYTTIEALDRFAQGQRTTLFHAFGTFFTTLLKNGVRYGGFLNGKAGLVLTALEAVSRVVRHLKLWLFWQVHEGRIRMDLGFALPRPGSAKAPSKADLERPAWRGDGGAGRRGP